MDDASADKLLKWLAAQLKGNDQGLVQVSLKALMSILRQDAYRQKFYHETDGLEAYVWFPLLFFFWVVGGFISICRQWPPLFSFLVLGQWSLPLCEPLWLFRCV
jgi:hypothetical protein